LAYIYLIILDANGTPQQMPTDLALQAKFPFLADQPEATRELSLAMIEQVNQSVANDSAKALCPSARPINCWSNQSATNAIARTSAKGAWPEENASQLAATSTNSKVLAIEIALERGSSIA
jgi:hypothetical protein